MRLFQQAGADKLAAFLLAEKLLFHPFRLHPGGRNDDERTIGARAPEVEDARRDFLARACGTADRSEEHTSELQSLMRISYAVFCLIQKQKTPAPPQRYATTQHTP